MNSNIEIKTNQVIDDKTDFSSFRTGVVLVLMIVFVLTSFYIILA